MLLAVDHVTRYGYDRPVKGVQQSLRLTPSAFDGQRVLSWDVTVPGGIKGGGFRDGTGDWVQAWSVPGPVTEVEVRVKGLVETADLAGVLRGRREIIPPAAWLSATPATRADDGIRALAEGLGRSGEALATAHALSAAVSEAIAYVPGVTRPQTTAAEALARGEGVCQDHAQVMIAAARTLDLPARYVTGYLFAADEPGEAAHAWAEIWVEALGWVGFDPANSCCPDARYIRIGCGLDAVDAAPIRGVSRSGLASERMEVEVRVAEGQSQSQSQQ